MNYRHAYHAGNFADVLKHSVLALVLEHLKQKVAPFRVIDSHAGAGLYDLESTEARKTGEWRHGIGRLFGPHAEPLPAPVAEILGPFLRTVGAENADGALRRYPGSPRLALALMRKSDRLVASELHPADAASLAALLRKDRRATTLQLDGWIALKSVLPPKERRGVVLIDAPFEQRNEFDRLLVGLREATRRFATGVYLLWYPLKDTRSVASLHRAVAAGFSAALSLELAVRSAPSADALAACGLLVINPPHTLEAKVGLLMPFLARRLAQGRGSVGVATRVGK